MYTIFCWYPSEIWKKNPKKNREEKEEEEGEEEEEK